MFLFFYLNCIRFAGPPTLVVVRRIDSSPNYFQTFDTHHRCLFTARALTCKMLAKCLQHACKLLAICMQKCLQHVNNMLTQCLQRACKMVGTRLQNACNMHAKCLQHACKMFAKCLQNACNMLTEGYQMLAKCLQDVHKMLPKCMQNAWKSKQNASKKSIPRYPVNPNIPRIGHHSRARSINGKY